MDSYFRIHLIKVPASLEEEVTLHCFAHSCLGISEALSYVQKDLVYDPKLRPQKFKDLEVYFEHKPATEFFTGLHALNAQIKHEIFEEEQKDWLAEWKKGFKPFQLVGPYWVIPSWEAIPEGVTQPLRIDPGMAFGTGTHATTQLAAAFVYRWFQNSAKAKEAAVIDVGTGTAILAMLAAKAGAKDVLGLDIDPEACRVARDNLKQNTQVEQVSITDLQIEEIRDQFDLVIANIIDGVLIKIKNELLRVLKPDGQLIVTGVLEERESFFLDEFMKDTQLKIERRLVKDEWVGYWMVPAAHKE